MCKTEARFEAFKAVKFQVEVFWASSQALISYSNTTRRKNAEDLDLKANLKLNTLLN
jgi:hypothetical protein